MAPCKVRANETAISAIKTSHRLSRAAELRRRHVDVALTALLMLFCSCRMNEESPRGAWTKASRGTYCYSRGISEARPQKIGLQNEGRIETENGTKPSLATCRFSPRLGQRTLGYL